jgi:hypothetical protein
VRSLKRAVRLVSPIGNQTILPKGIEAAIPTPRTPVLFKKSAVLFEKSTPW